MAVEYSLDKDQSYLVKVMYFGDRQVTESHKKQWTQNKGHVHSLIFRDDFYWMQWHMGSNRLRQENITPDILSTQ